MAIRVEVGRFCRKIGSSGLFFLKNGLELVICIEKWVGVGGFYQKNGCEWGLLFLKNGWGWVTFLENWWQWVVFIEKWVGVGCFY